MMDLAALVGEGTDLAPGQMCVRAAIVFVVTLLLIRLSGRRSFGQHSAFDACLTVLLGAVLSRAVVGASPFLATIASAATLVALHRAIAWASVRWPKFDQLVSGDIRVLVVDGVKQTREMQRALISERDLAEAIRKKCGSAEIEQIDGAVLERDGHVSVKPIKTRA